jgi:hypothetical protein
LLLVGLHLRKDRARHQLVPVGHLLHPVPIHAFARIEYIPGLEPRRKRSGPLFIE